MFNRLFSAVVILLSGLSSVSAAPIHLVDQQGREVVLQKPATRIVTTFTPANLFSLSLGLADHLVGIGGSTKHSPFINQLLAHRDPLVIGSRSAGTSLETIVALKPDLVLVFGKKDGYRLADRLTSLGIASLVIQPETFEDAQAVLELLAKATGTQDKAAKIAAENQRLADIIRSGLAGLTDEHRLRAYYANSSDLYRTASEQMFQHQLMAVSGIDNVAMGVPGFYPKVNAEQLLLWQPQLLVRESNDSTKVDEQLAKSLMTQLAKLPQIKIPKGSFWDMPSPMAMAGALYIAVNAYPERFNNIDLDAEIAHYYRVAFGDACLSPLHEMSKCQ
ncbi:periplasmic binding protein [Shewanella halifaxensis HAW-EB4]|uniref:Periplasmic binding protein n=1 Tax=Shewanella halifaxensis (strain HAW-EB4) TaxID=458817 RepID=B0TU54_SHEHH|nr:ABC transporter substrate-binding protein [Shewanella halifaxensis]ABZ78165.1 periplasmic binding protein [Shewanella halifaxensis HAW-EB4]